MHTYMYCILCASTCTYTNKSNCIYAIDVNRKSCKYGQQSQAFFFARIIGTIYMRRMLCNHNHIQYQIFMQYLVHMLDFPNTKYASHQVHIQANMRHISNKQSSVNESNRVYYVLCFIQMVFIVFYYTYIQNTYIFIYQVPITSKAQTNFI